MLEIIHQSLLWIHIPCGALSLVLFWIPVGVAKGSPIHRKVGRIYSKMMWAVLVTAFLMSISNLIKGNYDIAAFLGFLTIITGYPLWYSNEILKQKQDWSRRYYLIRQSFCVLLFLGSLGMILLGGIKHHFAGMGSMMLFFGLLGLPAIRDILMTRKKAMSKETRLKMHIQGMIISGIAAYTAFFAFGGSRLLSGILNEQLMILPWIAPTILGVFYSRYMKRKYVVHK
jgi:uncharacterized membrane protein